MSNRSLTPHQRVHQEARQRDRLRILDNGMVSVSRLLSEGDYTIAVNSRMFVTPPPPNDGALNTMNPAHDWGSERINFERLNFLASTHLNPGDLLETYWDHQTNSMQLRVVNASQNFVENSQTLNTGEWLTLTHNPQEGWVDIGHAPGQTIKKND